MMHSESEVRWVRAKNNVGQRTKVSDWHAIVPGIGSMVLPPGTACGVGLTGSLQFASHTEVRTLDGRRDPECIAIAEAWIDEHVEETPGALRPDEPIPPLAAPGEG